MYAMAHTSTHNHTLRSFARDPHGALSTPQTRHEPGKITEYFGSPGGTSKVSPRVAKSHR